MEEPVEKQRPLFLRAVWWFLLVIEVLIYSSYTILAHLCLVDGKLPFRSSSVVFSTEVIKIVISIMMLIGESRNEEIKMMSWTHSLAFLVPAIMYSINNNLSVYMQTHMDPTTYQILGNLKIATTAVLYRIIMQRQLSVKQWISLSILAAAGMFDSYGGLQTKDLQTHQIYVTISGLIMMCIYCLISGFTGVYTEYILKKHFQTSLHLQNILLYSFGIAINGGFWVVNELQHRNTGAESQGLFEGFTVYTWILVVTQAISGLIMSVIMKHGNNIIRLFIIASAMLMTTILSVVVFHLALNFYFLLAFVLVLAAMYLYYSN